MSKEKQHNVNHKYSIFATFAYLLHLDIVYLLQIYYIYNTVSESEIIDEKVGQMVCVKLMLLQ